MLEQGHVAQIEQTNLQSVNYKLLQSWYREYNLTEHRLRVMEGKKDINTQAMRSNNNDKRKTH